MSTIAVMQPYFLPYIGYFQLLKAVDTFVVYDTIQFTKKGWIHRNRIESNQKDVFLTIPLKKDSDFLNINQRKISENYETVFKKHLRIIHQSYHKSKSFDEVYPLVEKIFSFKSENLFEFVYNAIIEVKQYLGITTKIIKSSDLTINHNNYQAEEKVLNIVKNLNANTYVNSIGGQDLYNKQNFKAKGIELNFISTNKIVYKQLSKEFIPNLSILDVMMHNTKQEIYKMLNEYKLI